VADQRLSDRDLLIGFVRRLQNSLRVLIENNAPFLFRNAVALTAIQDGWSDIAESFDSLVAQIANPANDSALETHGLTGAQLQMKIRLFQIVGDALDATLGGSPSRRHPEESGRRRRPAESIQRRTRFWTAFGRRLRGIVKPFLHYSNSILGSLAEVIPIAGTVKEFKEGVEAAIDIQSNWRPKPPRTRRT